MKTATKTIKPATAPVAVVLNADVITKITMAGQAAASMFALTREAAIAATPELDKKLPVADRVRAVLNRYEAALKEAGHNVKAIFGDCLTLIAAGQQGVVVTVTTKDASGGHDTNISAADAVNQPKHGLRAAASQARELLGIGRAKGAGRKPATPNGTGINSGAAPDPVRDALTKPTAQQAFDAWVEQLSEYLADAVFHPQIAARLLETGWKLQRAKTTAKA